MYGKLNIRHGFKDKCPALGIWMKKQRLEKGLTLKEVAEQTNISMTRLWMYENQEKVPDISIVDDVMPVLGFKVCEDKSTEEERKLI